MECGAGLPRGERGASFQDLVCSQDRCTTDRIEPDNARPRLIDCRNHNVDTDKIEFPAPPSLGASHHAYPIARSPFVRVASGWLSCRHESFPSSLQQRPLRRLNASALEPSGTAGKGRTASWTFADHATARFAARAVRGLLLLAGSVITGTGVAGLAAAGSVITSGEVAGFAQAPPWPRTSMPAALRYALAVSRRTPSSRSIRRSVSHQRRRGDTAAGGREPRRFRGGIDERAAEDHG